MNRSLTPLVYLLLGRIGDVAAGIPLLHRILRNHNFGPVIWVTTPMHEELVRTLGGVDSVYIWDEVDNNWGLNFADPVDRIAIQDAMSAKSTRVYGVGAQYTALFHRNEFLERIGMPPDTDIYFAQTYPANFIVCRYSVLHFLKANAFLANMCFDRFDPKIQVSHTGTVKIWERLGLDKPYAILCIGGSRPDKRWEPERFAELANACSDVTFVCVGTSDDPLPDGDIVDARDMDMSLVVALAADAEFFVGGDTGSSWLCLLGGCPGVILIKPASAEQEPLGFECIVDNVPCRELDIASSVSDVLYAVRAVREEDTEQVSNSRYVPEPALKEALSQSRSNFWCSIALLFIYNSNPAAAHLLLERKAAQAVSSPYFSALRARCLIEIGAMDAGLDAWQYALSEMDEEALGPIGSALLRMQAGYAYSLIQNDPSLLFEAKNQLYEYVDSSSVVRRLYSQCCYHLVCFMLRNNELNSAAELIESSADIYSVCQRHRVMCIRKYVIK